MELWCMYDIHDELGASNHLQTLTQWWRFVVLYF